jgi:hypothetical protein
MIDYSLVVDFDFPPYQIHRYLPMPKPFVENYISFQLLAQKLMRTMYKADVVNHLQIKLTPPFLLPHGPFPRPMYATTRIFPPHSLSPHFPDAVFSREVPDIYLQYYGENSLPVNRDSSAHRCLSIPSVNGRPYRHNPEGN